MYSQVAQVGKGKGLGGTLDLTEKQSLRLSQLKIHSGPEPQLVTSMRRIDIVYLSQAERSGTGTIVTQTRSPGLSTALLCIAMNARIKVDLATTFTFRRVESFLEVEVDRVRD